MSRMEAETFLIGEVLGSLSVGEFELEEVDPEEELGKSSSAIGR